MQSVFKITQKMKNELNKLLENRIYNHEECVSKIEVIAEEFAIGFTEWRLTTHLRNADQYTMRELLNIYKVKRNL